MGVALNFKFDQNRLSGYRDFRGQTLGSFITLASGLYSLVLPYRCDCVFFLLALVFILSVLAMRFVGKSVSDTTDLVPSGTLNLNQLVN